MPAALAVLAATAGLLAAADAAIGRLPESLGLRRPGILAAVSGAAPVTPAPLPVPEPVTENSSSRATLARINAMFVELAARTRPRLRIAYLGDSLIEGDLITSELRAMLQHQLGGRGVGLVPLALPNADLRDTIRTTAGDGWVYQHLSPHESTPGPWGITAGYALAPSDPAAASVTFETGLARWRAPLPAADLYYGRLPAAVLASPASVRSRSARGDLTLSLTGVGALNRARVLDGPAPKLELSFTGAANLPLYGASFESPDGVILDSFALRGSTGNELVGLPAEMLQAFQGLLRYDIVILHFGVNVLYPAPEDYRRYRRTLRATIEHLAAGLPGAAFLVISTSDRGWRGPEGLTSHPHLPYVVEAQSQAAGDAGVAFFDLYRAMGAPGAMVRWADAAPPLARKDYTHFNVAGAREIAKLIKKCLVGGTRAKPS